MVTEIEEHLKVTDRTDKILDPIIGYDHKIDNMGMIIEEEIVDVKIIVEMITETQEDTTLEVNNNRK